MLSLDKCKDKVACQPLCYVKVRSNVIIILISTSQLGGAVAQRTAVLATLLGLGGFE